MNAVNPLPALSTRSLGDAFAFASFALAYLLLALFSASLPLFERIPLYIWPAHGLALGALLVTPAARWPAYLALVLLATIAAGSLNNLPGHALVSTCVMAVLLPTLAAMALARLAGPRVQVDSIRALGAFLVGLACYHLVSRRRRGSADTGADSSASVDGSHVPA